MKNIFLTIALAGSAIAGFGQSSREFTVYSNGLIYDDTTISRLKYIVDSLHIKYKKCDLNRNYYSLLQTPGYYLSMQAGKFTTALADIQNNMSLGDFIKKYPQVKIDSNILITAIDEEYRSRKTIEYIPHTMSKNDYSSISLDADSADKIQKNKYYITGRSAKWVYRYSRPDKQQKDEIVAIYMEKPLQRILFPERYAAMILYSDCMIDTSTNTFLPAAAGSYEYREPEKGSGFNKLRIYIVNSTNHISDMNFWYDSTKSAYIEKELSIKPEFKKLLAEAAEEALQLKYTTESWFEYYLEKYYSKNAALVLKRNRKVYGSCSMDFSPRYHVFEIAQLAAETADWQVFLRAHLDIMNDRIARAVDASYAQGYRQTYVKELEDLDINVHELMLATCFSIDNPAGNHYFGNIGRLGRAFAEAKDRPKLEQKVLAMIADTALDDYNRLRMHYLFLNYVYYLDKKEERLAGLQKLEEADKELPSYLLNSIYINKEAIAEGGEKE